MSGVSTATTVTRFLNRLRKLGFQVVLADEPIDGWFSLTLDGKVGFVRFSQGFVELLHGDRSVTRYGLPQTGARAWDRVRALASEIVDREKREAARLEELAQLRARRAAERAAQKAHADALQAKTEELKAAFAKVLADRGFRGHSPVHFIVTPCPWTTSYVSVASSVALDLGNITPAQGAKLVDVLTEAGFIQPIFPKAKS